MLVAPEQPPLRPQGGSLRALGIELDRASLPRRARSVSPPSPPRNLPAPPLSWRSEQRSIMNGYWISCSSHRRIAHVALADRHRGRFAVLVRPAAPAAAENVHQQEPPSIGASRRTCSRPCRPCGRPGFGPAAPAPAPGGSCRSPSAAECSTGRARWPACALSILPSGRISSNGRKQPSLTGAWGCVRHLKATRAAARPPE